MVRRRSAFGVWRSAFGVRRSAFGVSYSSSSSFSSSNSGARCKGVPEYSLHGVLRRDHRGRLDMSRRDQMMVARHEMPGNAAPENPSRRARYDWVARGVLLSCAMDAVGNGGSYRSLRDGSYPRAYQAFHAWLPSFHPSGTITSLRMP